MKKYCLALDLKNDPDIIQEYKQFHQNVWPEIIESITSSGIKNLDIYSVQDRLFMIIEAEDSFSFEEKSKLDASNPKVQEWEKLMWQYQQAPPGAKNGEKWLPMEQIYKLD